MSNPLPEAGRIEIAGHHNPDWHIHKVAKDFELIDAWRLPTTSSYGEFRELTNLFLSLDLANDEGSKATSLLLLFVLSWVQS